MKSFVEYCQQDYASGEGWVHPISKQECKKEIIKATYESLIKAEPAFKTPLLELFMGVEPRILATRLGMTSSYLLKRLKRVISLLICLSLNPELNPNLSTELEVDR